MKNKIRAVNNMKFKFHGGQGKFEATVFLEDLKVTAINKEGEIIKVNFLGDVFNVMVDNKEVYKHYNVKQTK